MRLGVNDRIGRIRGAWLHHVDARAGGGSVGAGGRPPVAVVYNRESPLGLPPCALFRSLGRRGFTLRSLSPTPSSEAQLAPPLGVRSPAVRLRSSGPRPPRLPLAP